MPLIFKKNCSASNTITSAPPTSISNAETRCFANFAVRVWASSTNSSRDCVLSRIKANKFTHFVSSIPIRKLAVHSRIKPAEDFNLVLQKFPSTNARFNCFRSIVFTTAMTSFIKSLLHFDKVTDKGLS